MPEIILKVILPLIGVIIIFVCVGAYFFKYGSNLKDSIQEIKMFGADMRISIITVFVFVGLIFIFSGTYFTIVNTNSTLSKILDDEKKKSAAYELELTRLQGQITALKISQNKTVAYFLDLAGIQELPDSKNLIAYYTIWGDEDKRIPLNCTPITSNEKPRLSVIIPDLDPKTFITKLVVEDIVTKKKWGTSSFFPLSPALILNHVN